MQMASLIAARKAAVSKLLEKILASPGRSPVAAYAAARSLSTNAIRQFDDARLDDRDLDLQRRPDSSPYRRGVDSSPALQGVFDPFNPTRSLSQVLNLMDQILDNPFPAAAPRGAAGGFRRGWDAWEDEHALHLRVDMPGLGKEQVKVWAEQNTLIIKGEEERETGEENREENAGRRYSSRIDLPPDAYKIDQIRAEMKNGVLKVVVPKAKEEERKDVFHVSVE